MSITCILGAAVVFVAACATAQVAPQPAIGDEPPGRTYEVQPGDTLTSIAARTGFTPDEIAEVNGLASKDAIRAGDLLFLPDAIGEAPARVVPSMPAPPPPVALPATNAPLAWPLSEGVMLRTFDPTARRPSEGLLFAAPADTPVLCAADGEVLFAGDERTAFGHIVVVKHDDGLVTVYAHLASSTVKAGQRVARGDVLGKVGQSGGVESPRLAFQVRRGRTPIDPLTVLPSP